jgi:hypothetical protein
MIQLENNVSVSFILLLLTASPTIASETDTEIQYLLETIEESGCTFVRNWSEHPADEARSHMEMKYDYAKDKITQTEQFIKYIATKSSITGKEYTIRCEDDELSQCRMAHAET